MNRYNPYTVPEGFFEDARKKAWKAHVSRRNIFCGSVAAFALAAILVILPPLLGGGFKGKSYDAPNVDALAAMYECDLFLQVNF